MLKELIQIEKKRAQLETRKWEISPVKTKYNKDRKSSTQKYDIKTSNCEKRKVQMQDAKDAFAIKRLVT